MNIIRLIKEHPDNSGKHKRKHRGQMLVMVAVMLPVLCGVVGLAVDAGYLYHLKRRMQTAADAGAMAAAQELKRKDLGQVISAAKADAALNGFDESHGEVIAVNYPPTSGSARGDLDFVEVIINQQAPTFFMRVLGVDSAMVRARAVGGLVNGGSQYCLYTLNPHQARALRVNGGRLDSSCGVIVNSDDRRALSVTNSIMQARAVDVVGGYENGGSIDPEPTTGVTSEDDPLADLQPPFASGPCDYVRFELKDSAGTLYPGIYCDGIRIHGRANAIFEPGTYVLRGGGLEISSDSTAEGFGVGFYNTFDNNFAFGQININSHSDARLSAPYRGEMAGILFFQDRDAPTNVTNRVNCHSNSWFEGTLYFPTQHLKIGSNSASTVDGAAWTLIIADTLEIGSHAQLEIGVDFESGPPPPPIKKAALIE